MSSKEIPKLYILVRQDLPPISTGKYMVHVGHICSNLIYLGYQYDDIRKWMEYNHPIIILSVKNILEMNKYIKRWNEMYNRQAIVIPDAGFYEVQKGLVIMCGIGVMYEQDAKDIGLKRLSLYKG